LQLPPAMSKASVAIAPGDVEGIRCNWSGDDALELAEQSDV
jgi:hypothetical protein